MKSRIFIFLLATIFSSLFFIPIIHAQGISLPNGGIDLSLSTDNPTPGQDITITARSFNAEIDSAVITWTVNGKQEQKGIGANTLKVTAPELGKKLIVNISAATTNGKILANSITISSGSVDMILENNGYVHPFFKGKIPLSYQNTFTVTAIPHIANSDGIEYDPKNLVYTWKKSWQILEEDSGYGKQSIQLTGDIVPRGYALTVLATTRDGKAQASGYATISFDSPSISFYVNDPLYGPYFNTAIGDNIRIGTQKETGVLMVPFGFNKPINSIGNLLFTWMINGVERTELATKESIILRAPSDSAGASNISLSIRNNKQFLQGATGGFYATFSTKTPGSASAPVNFQ